MGKYSRVGGKKSLNCCSTTNLVVFVAFCLVGIWMLISSVVPIQSQNLSTEENATGKSSKHYEDSSGGLSETVTRGHDNGSDSQSETNSDIEMNKNVSQDESVSTSEENQGEGVSKEVSEVKVDSESDNGDEGNQQEKIVKESSDEEIETEEEPKTDNENDGNGKVNDQEASSGDEQSNSEALLTEEVGGKTSETEQTELEASSGVNTSENQVGEEKLEGDETADEMKQEDEVPSQTEENVEKNQDGNSEESDTSNNMKIEKETQKSSVSKYQSEYGWKLCNVTAGPDHIPCLDNWKSIRKLPSTMHYEHRERHCPEEASTCFVPLPEGYKRPIQWPTSREKIWYHNVPHTKLAVVKGHQNWVKVTGEYLTFPGGGPQFKNGALHYIDFIQKDWECVYVGWLFRISASRARGRMGKVECYLYMQFKEHVNRVNLNKLEQNQCPELELVADFQKESLPQGMCAFLKDSNYLYMVGGERTLRDDDDWDFDDDNDFKLSDAFSSDVFVLDSSNGKISPLPSFPKPNTAKTNARALATINGKVYVMNLMPYYRSTGFPSFECFDSLKWLWEELPAPPDCAMASYRYHFVVGPKIYLHTLYGLYCYNVDESPTKWESIEKTKWQLDLYTLSYYSDDEFESDCNQMEELLDDSVPMKLAFPYYSICFAEPGQGGLAVGYTPKGLAAYLFAPDGDLLFQELLHSLNEDPKLPSLNQTYFGGKVCYAGDSKFCLILSGRINQSTWSLGIATFDVKFKTSVAINGDGGGIHFYHENPLCYHQFDDVDSRLWNPHRFEENYMLPRLYNYDIFPDAFVMSSEPKSERKREADSMEANYDGVGFFI